MFFGNLKKSKSESKNLKHNQAIKLNFYFQKSIQNFISNPIQHKMCKYHKTNKQIFSYHWNWLHSLKVTKPKPKPNTSCVLIVLFDEVNEQCSFIHIYSQKGKRSKRRSWIEFLCFFSSIKWIEIFFKFLHSGKKKWKFAFSFFCCLLSNRKLRSFSSLNLSKQTNWILKSFSINVETDLLFQRPNFRSIRKTWIMEQI